jgi:hypothetical protein
MFLNMNPTILNMYNIIKIPLIIFSVKVHLKIGVRLVYRNGGSMTAHLSTPLASVLYYWL